MTNADITFDSINQKIDVKGSDLSILDNLTGQLVLAEQTINTDQYLLETSVDTCPSKKELKLDKSAVSIL
jgi:hypothetical protein